MTGLGELNAAELGRERDAFLSETPLHSLVHSVETETHQVQLWFCPEGGIEALSVCGEGDGYLSALGRALEQLRRHPARQKEGA